MDMDRRSLLSFATAAFGAAVLPVAASAVRLKPTSAEVRTAHDLRGQFFDVFVDGTRIEHVLDVDCIEGWAVVGDMDENGKYQIDKTGDRVKTITILGNVELVPL